MHGCTYVSTRLCRGWSGSISPPSLAFRRTSSLSLYFSRSCRPFRATPSLLSSPLLLLVGSLTRALCMVVSRKSTQNLLLTQEYFRLFPSVVPSTSRWLF